MHRNTIIAICLAFCVVAIAAGWVVAGTSSRSAAVGAQATAPASSGTATPQPTTADEPTSAPTAMPTAAPSATPADLPDPTSAPSAEPAPAATAAPPEPTAAPPADTAFVEYTVQKGDMLNAIAKQYNVTAKDILAINDIPNPDSLTVGQVLRIPKQ
jgi:LysM repeat protein